jgi:2-oxoisovalerate dehydrogenase E1 component
VFGVTRHLTERFGITRCFNSPLAESTIIGVAIGLCFDGFHKPVVEIQFADYLWTGVNQLFNELASIHYRSAGEWHCPVVVRMPTGGYIQGGPYHSQSIEGFLAHCPGLKVVMPSNAKDAKLLLKAAIEDPNPVLFLEHKGLYRQRAFSSRAEPHSEDRDVLGKAEVVKVGTHVTCITWGMTTVMGYEIAEKLSKEMQLEIELIDLRTLIPYDKQTLRTSIKKTGKVLIAHEAPKQCGFGSELAAWIAEELFNFLDAPIRRLGSFESAVPYSKVLEDAVLLSKQEFEKALKELASF